MDQSPLPFVEMIALDELPPSRESGGNPRYSSKHAAYNPGGGAAYGGHVYSQSVWAAAQTVPEGMVVHNVHGYFTLPAYTDRPLIYEVQNLSSGRSYCTRFVTVKQPLEPCSSPFKPEMAEMALGKLCFVSISSFKKDEPSPTKHQHKANLKERYAEVIKNDPTEHPIAPRVDTPWYHRLIKEHQELSKYSFPGLDIRKVDMTKYNTSKPPEDWRHISFYRALGTIPPTMFNLHACAHLYASDRNSLFIISNANGFGDEVSNMGSLSHSVVFHVSSKDLVMNQGEWWTQEAWTPRSEGGRGMHESKIWDQNGLHIASTWQDGMVRKAENLEEHKQRQAWLEGMVRKNIIDATVAKSASAKHKL